MAEIYEFPQVKRLVLRFPPRQRVFYIGHRYVGPFLCQDIQHLYLKRHGWKNGVRKWSMMSYVKFDDYDTRKYSWEWETCEEDEVPQMLEEFDMGREVSLKSLRGMGWDGRIKGDGKVHYLYPTEKGENHG